jgi:hypothetical protein
MTKFVITVLAAVTFVQPALSAATNSFVPHPHSKQHAYGAPIEPAIVGHGKSAHHKRAPKQ